MTNATGWRIPRIGLGMLLTINIIYTSAALVSSASSPMANLDAMSNNIASFAMDNKTSINFATTPMDSDVTKSWLEIIMTYTDPFVYVFMVFGAVLPYIPQYIAIRKTNSSKGFSTLVCLVLLISNITRIIFWFGKSFLIALLVQSIVMTIAQILLLEICVRTRRQNNGPMAVERHLFSRANWFKNFWRWTEIYSYLIFLVFMTTFLGGLMFIFNKNDIFVETLGYVSTLSDSVLALPQLIKNFRRKSIVGLSLAMVLLWAAGDLFKTAYFVIKAQPLQFIVCGSIQIVLDVMILIQMVVYRNNIGDGDDDDQQASS